MADPSSEKLSTKARLKTLLELSGCSVEDMSAGICDSLVAEYFTPDQPESTLCLLVDKDIPTATIQEHGAAVLGKLAATSRTHLRSIVLISPDNDDSGRAHADVLREHLVGDRPLSLSVRRIGDYVSHAIQAMDVSRFYSASLSRRDVEPDQLLTWYCSKDVEQGEEDRSAQDEFNQFLQDERQLLCALVGGFGMGKTTLLLERARLLGDEIRSPVAGGTRFLPIYVDLAGAAGRPLSQAVSQAIREVTGIRGEVGVNDLRTVFGERLKPLLLFDSLDEQVSINPRSIAFLVSEVIEHVSAGVKCVLALRPELFEGRKDREQLLFSQLDKQGIAHRTIVLSPLHSDELRPRIAAMFSTPEAKTLSPEVKRAAQSLSSRPLWLATLDAYIGVLGQHVPPTLLGFVEFCIDHWASRESRTKRPILRRDERDVLGIVLAYCLNAGVAVAQERKGRVHRSELTRFVRTLVPRWQDTGTPRRTYLRWVHFPPDLVAESLAVSSLMTCDDEGYLGFADDIFADYYFALGVSRFFGDKSEAWMTDDAFMDIFGLQRGVDFFGIGPLPERESFRELLAAVLAPPRFSGLEVRERIKSLLCRLQPPHAGTKSVPQWDEFVFRLGAEQAEETLSYEARAPEHWPHFGSFFAPLNAVRVIGTLSERGSIESVDLSYLDFSGLQLQNLVFEDCDLRGTNFSYADITGTEFRRCRLDWSLFYRLQGAERARVIDAFGEAPVVVACRAIAGIERPKSQAHLDEIIDRQAERWIWPERATLVEENQDVGVWVPPFVADLAPVTNSQFDQFLKENRDYRAEIHGRQVENPYYLAEMSRSEANVPVVYVTLFAAMGFAVGCGKRLPSAAEFAEYERALGANREMEPGGVRLGSPPGVASGAPYGPGQITEWTYQVDDSRYWNGLVRKGLNGHRFRRRICDLPPFRRNEGMRCEYLLMGKSFLPGKLDGKNSKAAMIINPDQGFRCVRSYGSVIRETADGA